MASDSKNAFIIAVIIRKTRPDNTFQSTKTDQTLGKEKPREATSKCVAVDTSSKSSFTISLHSLPLVKSPLLDSPWFSRVRRRRRTLLPSMPDFALP